MELEGSTSTLPSGGCAVFMDNELVFAVTTSSSVSLTMASVELCGIESTTTLENFVEFQWRNLRQSTIYRSPVKSRRESGQFRAWSPEPNSEVLWKIQPLIYGGISISTTPPNFSSIRRFKLREPSDEWTNFRICFLREYRSDPNSCFFMNVILDNLFRGILF